MRIVGLDLGSKTLGVAISDKYEILASTYDTFRFYENQYNLAIDYLNEIIQKENIKTIVLGYPKHMNGDIGIRAKISEQFKEDLEKTYDVSVILIDERLSSKEVNNIMIMGKLSREKRKSKKDELAAVVILQNYLDSRRK